MAEKHSLHLKHPDLQTSPEVSQAVKRRDRLDGEKTPNEPGARLEVYMSRLEKIFLTKDERVRKRNIDMLREHVYDAFIIKRENVPESYFKLQQQVARERGAPVEHIPPDTRERMIDTVIEDQKASLDGWIDYLSSDDAVYPTWYKYIVFRNIVKLSQFDKELGKFKTRTDSTVAPFPDIFREPLAQMADIYEQIGADNKKLKDTEIGNAFSKKFPTLYAELIQKSIAASLESKEETKGIWVKYSKGEYSAAERLYQSLEGKGTGWCTAGRTTAQTQLESGDFHVYYTNDSSGTPSQPRIAIRMEDNKIAEVRGILMEQAVEAQMNDILEAKLKEFGSEADAYKKKSSDMRLLTLIEKKSKAGESLTRDELVFLYEINSPIEGFGYKPDPRTKEIRATRNHKIDAAVVFDCAPEDIAWNREDISASTKVYIGPLFNGVFHLDLEHIYTSFPEHCIVEKSITIGGKNGDELESELKKQGAVVSRRAEDIMKKKAFDTFPKAEQADIVILKVSDLGFPYHAKTKEIYMKAQELGLELCPAEVGPQLRLQYMNQPIGEYVYIGMKQITSSSGFPFVLIVDHDFDKPYLDAFNAEPSYEWTPDFRFAFRKSPLSARKD